mgnify:FL=1
MKKQSFSFGRGSDTIFLNLANGEFLSLECNSAAIEAAGVGYYKYYSSRSGSSGAANFTDLGPLVPFGTYRTDTTYWQRELPDFTDDLKSFPSYRKGIKPVHVTTEKTAVYGYAGFISHRGFDPQKPIILTDGRKVAFVRHEEVREFLLAWDTKFSEEATHLLRWVDVNLRSQETEWWLSNENHFSGIDAEKFLNRTAPKSAMDELRKIRIERFPAFIQKTGAMFVEKNGQEYLCWNHSGPTDGTYYADCARIELGYPTSGAAQPGNGWDAISFGFRFPALADTAIGLFREGQYNVQFFVELITGETAECTISKLEWYMEAGIENHSTAMWSRFEILLQQLGADITVADEAPSPAAASEEEE